MKRVPIFISDPLFDEITNRIKESYPNSCVLFIDRIENPELEALYETQKSTVMESCGIIGETASEALLFHGTHANIIDKIATEGFDPAKNVTSAYGRGTYFAKNAKYSISYMKSKDNHGISYMFLAKVIIGKTTKGSSSIQNIVKENDTYVNDIENPTIYVTPYRYGAYPKYIIAFHKEAA